MCGDSSLDEVEVSDVSQDRMLTGVSVPYGLVLKTNRVGKVVIFGNQVDPGETVRFDYAGGSNDGERNVLVVNVDTDGLEGLTLERDGEFRRYTDDKISRTRDIIIVEPFVKVSETVTGNVKRVRFDEAGDALLASLSGEQLAELYAEYVISDDSPIRRDRITFDADSGEVVVKLPVETNKFNIDSDIEGSVFNINNKNGGYLHLFVYGDEGIVGLTVSRDNQVYVNELQLTPERLRDELVKFLA